MHEKKEIGNLIAIKQYFGMTMEETRAEAQTLSEEERVELGGLCREALKAEETAEMCTA